MPDSNGPSPLKFWLEEALLGWMAPVAAVALIVLVGILYWVGVLSEAATAGTVVVVAPLVAVIIMARAAVDPARSAQGRALVWAASAATLLLAVVPAFRTVFPGTPLFTGDAGVEGDSITLPPGVDGRIRLLVSGKLQETGEPTVHFTLTGTQDPVEGVIERTFSMARVGRGGRARVAHDHVSDYYQAVIPHGTQALKLDRVAGQLGGRLQVSGYRVFVQPTELVILSILLMLLVAAIDARVAMQGNLAIASGMALAFGLIVALQATPVAAVGVSVGGTILGAITGSLSGGLASWILRKFVPAERRRGGGKSNGKSSKPKDAEAA